MTITFRVVPDPFDHPFPGFLTLWTQIAERAYRATFLEAADFAQGVRDGAHAVATLMSDPAYAEAALKLWGTTEDDMVRFVRYLDHWVDSLRRGAIVH